MMQLLQWNWFLDRGVLRVDAASGRMAIDYTRYHDAVAALLKEVLALQDAGDKAAATRFLDRWGTWNDALHGRIAAALREQQPFRFRLFEYDALSRRQVSQLALRPRQTSGREFAASPQDGGRSSRASSTTLSVRGRDGSHISRPSGSRRVPSGVRPVPSRGPCDESD